MLFGGGVPSYAYSGELKAHNRVCWILEKIKCCETDRDEGG